MQKPRYKLYCVFIAVFLVTGILLTTLGAHYNTVLSVALEGSSTDYDLQKETYQAGLDMNVELVGEGMVLLKNENQTLPLSAGNINLFGNKAVDFIYNGSGSSAGNLNGAVNLKDGLENAGFQVNPDLWGFLEKNTQESDTKVHEGNEVDISNYPTNEMSIDSYTGEYSFDNLKNYSDIAVVCLGRSGGEGQDLPRYGYGEDQTDHYLQLTVNEKALLEELNKHDFTTIVLINSSYAMELGFLDQEQYGVEAALWIGGPGIAGSIAVGRALNGVVNPSGRLVDTYPYDLTTQSTYYTSDYYYYLDAENMDKQLAGFSNYSEGIYVGYRWYETADAEGYWDSVENEYGSGYEGVVQFPFGYGLSYGEFKQTLTNVEYKEDVFTFTVKVENISEDYAGKDVIQIYCETPYVNGSIEKSKVELCAFHKTDELKPGESGEYTLTVALEDVSSYDESADNGTGAYVLETGEYLFYLSDNAHSYAFIDKDEATKCFTYRLEDEIIYSGKNKKESDNTAAVNQFDHSENGIIKLSRTNKFKNAEEAIFSEIENEVLAPGEKLYDAVKTNATVAGDFQGEVGNTETGLELKYTMADMSGADYNDDRWEYFISQMTVDDMQTLIGTGGWSTAAIASISKDKTTDIDGPFGLSNYIKNELGNNEGVCVSYCSEVVIASTWNQDLAVRFGETVGAEGNATGVSGWYAPGANLHRSAFSGRNPEYYSEDSYLSGVICASTVKGALEKGLYVYVKHFAFNDQEANRTNKENCWMTEQTAREIYLRPFEMAVKEGGATGLMVSYMWFDEQWCGGSYELMTNVVRGEWGFQGMVITDNYCAKWMNPTKAVLAGTDLILSNTSNTVNEDFAATPEGITVMKQASKNILYTIANAQGARDVQATSGVNYWKIIYITGQVLLYGTAAILFLLLLLRHRKYKKSGITMENQSKKE